MRPFGTSQGQRQPGFDSSARGFGSWGSGRARGPFRGAWSGNFGSGNVVGQFGGTFGSASSGVSGGFGSGQSPASGYESGNVSGQFGSTAGSVGDQGFAAKYYDDSSGQYGQ